MVEARIGESGHGTSVIRVGFAGQRIVEDEALHLLP